MAWRGLRESLAAWWGLYAIHSFWEIAGEARPGGVVILENSDSFVLLFSLSWDSPFCLAAFFS